MHSQKITHRDLKPANILVYPGMRVKICDFGLSKLTDNSRVSISAAGTVMFSAPEVMGRVKGAKIAPFKADIFSLGLTACFMMNREVPDVFEIFQKDIPFHEQYS